MLNIISSVEELNELKDELVTFYRGCDYKYFLSPEYCIQSYETFHNQERDNVFFIINKDKNKITGYMPLIIDSRGVLKFINDKDTDFLSEVGRFTFNDYKKIVQEILSNTFIKRIDLNNFPIDAKFPHYLKHFLGMGCIISGFNNHSYLQCHDEISLLKHLSSSGRSELKRISKKNADFTFTICAYPTPFPKNKLITLRKKMIESGERDINFFNDKIVEFIEKLYVNEEIEIFTKKNEDQFISASIVLKNETGKKLIWMDLFNDQHYINLSAYIEYIYSLDAEKNNYINFGRGSYDYKAKNFQPTIETLYNLRYSKSKWDFYFTNYYPIKEFVKRIVRAKK